MEDKTEEEEASLSTNNRAGGSKGATLTPSREK
jgi:hypothetical protein